LNYKEEGREQAQRTSGNHRHPVCKVPKPDPPEAEIIIKSHSCSGFPDKLNVLVKNFCPAALLR